MIKRLLLFMISLILIGSLTSPTKAENTPKAPFFYYYSSMFNAFVIERADGTDSRFFGEGIMPPDYDDATNAVWSPSGQWLAWMANKMAGAYIGESVPFILNRDGKTRLTLLDNIKGVESLRWSPTRDIVMVWANEFQANPPSIQIYLIDVAAQKIIATVTEQSESMLYESTSAWSKDGRLFRFAYQAEQDYQMTDYHLATVSLDGKVEDHPIATPTEENGIFTAQQWWPGNSWNAYLEPDTKTLMVGSTIDPAQVLHLAIPEQGLEHIAWNPDGQHAFVFAGEDLWLLTLPAGTFKRISDHVVLPLQNDFTITGIASWSPDGRYGIFLKTDATFHLLNMNNFSATTLQLPALDDKFSMVQVIWTPDSKQMLIEWGTSYKPQLYRYDILSQTALSMGLTSRLFGVSPDENYFMAHNCVQDISGSCIETADGQLTTIIPTYGIYSIGDIPGSYRFHPAQDWVIIQGGNETGSGSLYSVVSLDGKVQRHLTDCSYEGTCIGWLPDTSISEASYPHYPTSVIGLPEKTLTGDTCSVASIGWSRDGKTITSTNADNSICSVWDARTGQLLKPGQGSPTDSFNDLAESPDGHWYVSKLSDGLNITNTQKGVDQDLKADSVLAWSQDSSLLVTHLQDTIQLWELPSLHLKTSYLATGTDGIWDSMFFSISSDKQMLAETGSWPAGTVIWDLNHGFVLMRIREAGIFKALAWSPDSRQFALGFFSGVQIWDVAPDGSF